MDSARDKTTEKIVEAEMLWLLDSVDKYNYDCWGCGIDMYPSSWAKGSKKRPSFNKYPNQSHDQNCDADAEVKIVANGKIQSVRHYLDSSPSLSPSRLQLIDSRQESNGCSGSNEEEVSTTRHSTVKQSPQNTAPSKKSRRPANTIRPICRAFINFPFDRNMSLDIPNVSGHNYMTIFKKLGSKIQTYDGLRVFYSALRWKKIAHNDQYLIILLTAGLWVDGEPIRTYQIHVDWGAWSQAKRTMLLNELEVAQNEAIEAKKTNKNDKAWIFFIGEQDAENPETFYVKDQRLICSIVGDIIYPRIV